MKNKRLSTEGFTLVELIVAIAVGAIVTITLSQVVNNYVHLSQRGRWLSLANSFVEAKAEALRNGGYNGLSLGTVNITNELPSQLPPGKSATMTITSPSGGIKQVYLTVTYKDQGQNQTFNYTTYIGELGVGQ